jgi:hypothetical protein
MTASMASAMAPMPGPSTTMVQVGVQPRFAAGQVTVRSARLVLPRMGPKGAWKTMRSASTDTVRP